jgi:hypothetical protein
MGMVLLRWMTATMIPRQKQWAHRRHTVFWPVQVMITEPEVAVYTLNKTDFMADSVGHGPSS